DVARSALRQCGAHLDWVHAGNSAAALRYGARGCNLVRPGLLLYGIRPVFPQKDEGAEELLAQLKPVLALKARVGAVRELPAGHTISYGATYRLTRRSRLATVLIGYGDGYPRRLSNQGAVLIHGCRSPIVGRVCMDQIIVDVTDLPVSVAPGDECVCIGAAGS